MGSRLRGKDERGGRGKDGMGGAWVPACAGKTGWGVRGFPPARERRERGARERRDGGGCVASRLRGNGGGWGGGRRCDFFCSWGTAICIWGALHSSHGGSWVVADEGVAWVGRWNCFRSWRTAICIWGAFHSFHGCSWGVADRCVPLFLSYVVSRLRGNDGGRGYVGSRLRGNDGEGEKGEAPDGFRGLSAVSLFLGAAI